MSALRAASATLLAAALAAVALLVRVAVGGEVSLGAVVEVTPLRAVLLVFLSALGAVVASYAVRNLAGQHRLGRFAVLELALVGGLALAVVAATLSLLLAGWVLAGGAVALLVAHSGTPRARSASRAVAARLVVGDAALALAVVLVAAWWGTVEVSALSEAAGTAPAWQVGVVAGLVLLGGAVRSALVPFHRWLPETAEAPSPVSAVLHAGVVNGVGILALLLWPVVAASPVARGAVLVLGAATVLLGTFQQRVRPDVKGRLVSSTSSQMGYLAVTVGLGLPAAVLVHLMGHGLWKASLFLGAGGAVERARAARGVHVVRHPAAAPLAAATAGAVVVAAAAVPGPWGGSLLAGPALLLPVVVAALAAAVAGFAAVRHARGSAVLALALVLVAAAAYPLVVRAVDTALEPVLEWATPTWGEPGAAGLALVVAGLIALGLLAWYADRRAASARAPRLVRAVARGTLTGPRAGRRAVVTAPTASVPADTALVAAAVPVAADVVSPLWPLHAFVARNPLAGLEHLSFADAVRASRATWGTGDLVSASMLRAAYADGVVTDTALDAVAAEVAPGGDLPVPVAMRSRRELVRALLLRDDVVSPQTDAVRDAVCTTRSARPARALTPGERAAAADRRAARVDERGRDLVSSYAARVLGTTAWAAPDAGIWASVRADASALDRLLGARGAGDVVASLPSEPGAALAEVVARLGLRRDQVVPFLSRLLARDPGWPAHVRWRARVGVGPEGELVDLLAARAALDLVVASVAPAAATQEVRDDLAPLVAALLDAAGLPVASVSRLVLGELVRMAECVDDEGLGLLRLKAWEASYRAPLLEQVGVRARELADLGHEAPREAQVVTCIDVRSERLRRHLEAVGPWETLGAAGFFGLPLCHVSPSGAVTERLPALLRPQHVVTETAPDRRGQWLLGDAAEAVHGVEAQPGAPFALAEAAGWVSGPLALLHTLRPRAFGRAGAGIAAAVGDALRGELDVCATPEAGFTLDELVAAAAGFLRSTGLLSPAPLVVLVGHQGHAANNPHLAAYDCGACGGQAGDVSARAMAAVLNDARVREGLRAEGVEVPAGTWFVGGLHDTTRDTVVLLDEVPDHLRTVAARLETDLGVACDAVIEERGERLPGLAGEGAAALRRSAEAAAVDWANPRPEWGLVRNAALVIGPRSLTEGLDLDGRVFLHSYRHDLDTDGSALEQLLTAPLVVAQWISTQYLCSTLEPERFGAGDKTTHNVVASYDGSPAPLTGVLTGARGDLRLGLPWQGLSTVAPVDGRWIGRPVHEPLRLLALVHARPERVDAVLRAHPEVARLVVGGWISLVVVDPATGRLHRADERGGWVVEQAPSEALDVRRGSDRDDSVSV